MALAENRVEPDLVIGTSAGGLNAAWVAAHGMSEESLAGLAMVWARLRRADVFPIDVRQVVRAVLGRSTAVSSARRLGHLVSAYAGIESIEDAAVPLHLVAADLLTGTGVRICDGPLADGVLASAAIPGVFPPVHRNGRALVDGAVAGRSGVGDAVELGATTVYALPTGAACAPAAPPHSAIGVALHALTVLTQRRLAGEMADYAAAAEIRVLPPLCRWQSHRATSATAPSSSGVVTEPP